MKQIPSALISSNGSVISLSNIWTVPFLYSASPGENGTVQMIPGYIINTPSELLRHAL